MKTNVVPAKAKPSTYHSPVVTYSLSGATVRG